LLLLLLLLLLQVYHKHQGWRDSSCRVEGTDVSEEIVRHQHFSLLALDPCGDAVRALIVYIGFLLHHRQGSMPFIAHV
jgi:hypothetical protein